MASSGIQLSLLIGPVPMPAPREVVEALAQVSVESGSGDTPSGFELVFEPASRSPLRELFLIAGGAMPLMRVVLLVHIGGAVQAIVDGVVTNVESVAGPGGPGRLVVKGKDLSALMDLVEIPGLPFPAMPPSARVLLMLAKYAAFGVIPIVIPSIIDEPPLPTERIPQQQGSDLAYIRQLAKDAGHIFYLDPGPAPGSSTAYWGPEMRIGAVQPALTTGMDALNNVEELSFDIDRARWRMPIVFMQEPNSKAPIPIPIPDVSPLTPPLGAIPPLPPRIEWLRDTAKLSPGAALMQGLAYAAQHSDSVAGKGRLDVVRYGRALKARALVGVRGAGIAFDGLHYVTSVSHRIERGSYTQHFALARNAIVANIPVVAT